MLDRHYFARFQTVNNAAFAKLKSAPIPDTGYTITNAYFAFAMDADVSVAAKQNFTTAFLPFNMGIAFKSNWYAPDFLYPCGCDPSTRLRPGGPRSRVLIVHCPGRRDLRLAGPSIGRAEFRRSLLPI